MAAPRPPDRSPEWLPSGFPPRSFPPGGAEALPGPPSPRRGRGRWLAAAAVFLAVILLAAGLLLASRDDGGDPELATSTSTTAADTSFPVLESTTTTVPVPPSIEPVGTTAAGPSPPVPEAPAAAPGRLEPSLSLVTLPKTDASAGASRQPLKLRNEGGTALTYTSQPSSPGLTVAPAQGAISPGGSIDVTVTLDGTRVDAEGPFRGTLGFGGTGGARTVEVQSLVGRPPDLVDDAGEACPPGRPSCSRLIKLTATSEPNASPCNTSWVYSVTINDQSRIQTAKAIARRGTDNADTSLRRVGTGNVFQSDTFSPLASGTVRFAIEAVDEHGFGRRLAEQVITCA